jgi:hypothetical protein
MLKVPAPMSPPAHATAIDRNPVIASTSPRNAVAAVVTTSAAGTARPLGQGAAQQVHGDVVARGVQVRDREHGGDQHTRGVERVGPVGGDGEQVAGSGPPRRR